MKSVVLAAMLSCCAASALAETPVELADPFLGAEGGGNTVPGAQVPFGFVMASPDTTRGDTNGYDGWSPVVGFSATHVSGTGGSSKYGNFRVTPTIGEVNPRNLSFPRSHETASPGYYAMALGDIQVELTATRMVAVERYGFPEGRTGNILLDVTSAVQLGGGGPRATSAHAEVAPDGSLSGQASFVGGWNGSPYTLYFYAIFDRCPIETGTWTAAQGASHVAPGNKVVDGGNQSASLANRLGLYARFDPAQGPVTMKLAVSFVSVAAAKAHLNAEAAADFGQIRGAAGAQWKQVLGQIEAEGGTPAQRRQFFSALYRVHTMPHDVSGDNPWWTSTEPHYEDFYTLWDTFRGVHPLLTLIQPQRQRDMVRSLLDTYQHTGWLPDARIAGATGLTQGGSNGDVLVADAVVKHLGGFDLNQAYEAVRKDGEVDSPESLNFGRDLKDYAALGYVSLTATRSASRTMEYAYDDFAIAQVARAAGHGDAADRFVKRSYSWRNLWDKDTQCIRPRYVDGAWLENFVCSYRYPDATTPWWDAPYYEGSGYQYSTYVPHDVRTLMAYTGGRDGFVAWLDRFFVGDYDQGNEPDILAPYLYINAGRPDRTADRVRRILSDNYQPTHGGLPGNDDAGAMSAWYVWGAIGLYPNAGQPWYYIGSPLFVRSVIRLESGKTFTISAPATSEANRYVVAARLNGKPLDRAWLRHDEIVEGGVLELDMADKPGTWATTPPDLP